MIKCVVLLAALAACSNQSAPPAPAAGSAAAAPEHHSAGGKVERKTFHSDALGVDKHVLVYTPLGYDPRGATRYPVFYYLHGLGGDETNWVEGGKLDTVADSMKLQAIVVMPDGDDSFYVDALAPINYDECMKTGTGLFFPQRSHKDTCVHANRYETYMTKDLVGWVDATYHTLATREGRGLAGLSMGGYGALMLAMRHQDLWSAAASHSGVDALLYAGPHPYVAGKAELVTDPNVWGKAAGNIGEWVQSRLGPDIDNWKAHDPAVLVDKLEPGKLAIYLDCGTEDDFKLDAGAAYLDDLLTARHIEHTFFLGPGTHSFSFWGPRLPSSLAFLRDHVAGARAGS